MPNELIMNLSTVYMNCKRGTTTVWDAEQVEKAIKILMEGNGNDRHIEN